MEKPEPKFKIEVVDRKVGNYYESLGIKKERAEELMLLNKVMFLKHNQIDDVMVACTANCETLTEVVFTIFKLGELFNAMGVAADPLNHVQAAFKLAERVRELNKTMEVKS